MTKNDCFISYFEVNAKVNRIKSLEPSINGIKGSSENYPAKEFLNSTYLVIFQPFERNETTKDSSRSPL